MTAPFRGSDSGLSRQRLRGARYRQLSRDLYVLRDAVVDLRTRTEAAVLALPGAVACRSTAALLQRLPVPDCDKVHVSRGPVAARSERADVTVHRNQVGEDELLELDGLRMTDGPRTFVDLAAELDLEALVALGDAVLRRHQPEDVDRAVRRARGRAGAVAARLARRLLDAGAASPAESRARLRLHAAGFTGLRHGVVVRDSAGGWLAEPDLADVRARVAVQHDGLVHLLGDPERRRKDLQRDEVVRQQDWQLVVATAVDERRPGLLLDKVAAAYRRAGLLWGPEVVPSHLR